MRYSRRVSREEISSKNNLNLNISRYINIAVADAEIDLQAVHDELQQLEQSIQAARDKHNAFLL
jgi:type I restriction enzyme M protein